MKNPGFLVNGTIVVLSPIMNNKTNIIAVVVGRYSNIVEGYPEYIGLPIVLDTRNDKLSYLTSNSTMSSYISFFEDEVLSSIGIIKEIESKEWVIINTINYLRNKDDKILDKNNIAKKLEITLEDALEEKNYSKFRWIIFNLNLDQYTLKQWIDKLIRKKEFFIEYFSITEKDIDNCIRKLQNSLLQKI